MKETQGLLSKSRHSASSGLRGCCSRIKMKTLFCWTFVGILAAGSGFVAMNVMAYPFHASCRVDWSFGKSCDAVQAALRNQMEIWKTADNCGTGQKCLYTFLNFTSTTLTGLHETPVKHYVDDISFTFTPGGGEDICNVQGFSSSQLWYAILDYGTNYCNIKNLVDGAGLQDDAKFSESTSNSVCTQYTSANCEVY